MTQLGIAFDGAPAAARLEAGSAFKRTLLALAPTGRVPLLVDDGFAVWDCLAIAEYLAERFRDAALAARRARRAHAPAASARKCTAGFGALRERFPMNIEASLPEIGPRIVREDAAVAQDLARIESMWSERLAAGGPFLFGAFSAADAFYAPVCSRLRTYGVPLSPASAAYVDRIHALPSMRRWCDAARAEHEFVVEDEPYRTRA